MSEFERVLKRISPKLKGIAHKLNGRFTYFSDDDLYQEASVFLWQGLEAGRLQDKTDSYLLQGCYFHLQNYIRTAQDGVGFVYIDAPVSSGGPGWEEILHLEDRRSGSDEIRNKADVAELMESGLSERERQVLTMLLEGLTVRQIGERLGISHVMVLKIKKRIAARWRA